MLPSCRISSIHNFLIYLLIYVIHLQYVRLVCLHTVAEEKTKTKVEVCLDAVKVILTLGQTKMDLQT